MQYISYPAYFERLAIRAGGGRGPPPSAHRKRVLCGALRDEPDVGVARDTPPGM